jgi:hypothetical protein
MPKRAGHSTRAGAVEGFRFFFSEERPPAPPPKPFLLTYEGDDVVEVPGVGKFQNGTTAEVDTDVARALEGRPGWRVTARPRKLEQETEE